MRTSIKPLSATLKATALWLCACLALGCSSITTFPEVVDLLGEDKGSARTKAKPNNPAATEPKSVTAVHIIPRQPPPPKGVSEIRVFKNDTLYGIAWRLGLDYRRLAKWNNISEPYTVYPGQKLKVPPRVPGSPGVAASSPTPKPTPSKTSAAKTQSKTATKSTKSSKKSLPKGAPRNWNWPYNGKVIEKFAPKNEKNGIKIAGRVGVPIRSAVAGEVVYAGDGLRGYGNLIIIKHTDSYLSAYAHNQRILVAEGNRVKARQRIGLMGRDEKNRPLLHFEIRKDGKPLDPLRFLP